MARDHVAPNLFLLAMQGFLCEACLLCNPRYLFPDFDEYISLSSTVTPQNFDLDSLIKILPGNLNFHFLDFSLDFKAILFFVIMECLPQGNTFQIYYWTCLPFKEKNISIISGTYLHNHFSLSFIPKMIFN